MLGAYIMGSGLSFIVGATFTRRERLQHFLSAATPPLVRQKESEADMGGFSVPILFLFRKKAFYAS